MNTGSLKEFLSNIKRFLRGERPRPAVPLSGMACRLCGGPGLYPVGRGEWVCEVDMPPIMRRTPITLAGDPGQ